MTAPEKYPDGFIERMAELDRRRSAARDALNEANRDITALLRELRRHIAAEESARKTQEDQR